MLKCHAELSHTSFPNTGLGAQKDESTETVQNFQIQVPNQEINLQTSNKKKHRLLLKGPLV